MNPEPRLTVDFTRADPEDRDLLGGKGAGLAAMTAAGLPVPPGFIITTAACRAYYRSGGRLPDGLMEQVSEEMSLLEKATGKRFGGGENPLLVSVRSGSPVSMPGMMDTMLNLGMTRAAAEALAESSGDPDFAWDTYRRFLRNYAEIVTGVDPALLDRAGEAAGRSGRPPAGESRKLAARLDEVIRNETGTLTAAPEDPREQLREAVAAVFDSWTGKRAADYRRMEGVPETIYTAAVVQAMVFGNRGPDSGSGVAFSRNPATGEKTLWGEYLPGGQGEDVVAGVRTPEPVSALAGQSRGLLEELSGLAERLERFYRDAQDIEFTVEEGKLWLLQTRSAKRTGRAALRNAVDMAEEGLIDRTEAVLRVAPGQLEEVLHPVVTPGPDSRVLVRGQPASPGGATGQAVFTADEAAALAAEGRDVILFREETSPDDFHGMVASQAIVTARGGMTSHAAVVARGMGKCCVVGCSGMAVDPENGRFLTAETEVRAGEVVTVDGTGGAVYAGEVPKAEPGLDDYFDRLMEWADEGRRMRVRANADTAADARAARRLGAEGIGLCRTEHMFFAKEGIAAMRRMIMASTAEERADALRVIEPRQTADFQGLFAAMSGTPVTIRLLDPPLHEFLPARGETASALAELGRLLEAAAGPDDRERIQSEIAAREKLLSRIDSLAEANPMLGHRGCRLGVSFPEITVMQARAIFTAAVRSQRAGAVVGPEIMIPLVAYSSEFQQQRVIIDGVAAEVFAAEGETVDYRVGSMIELPRAALTAGEIARDAHFISFGTNDLTQTATGLSRDDSSRFLPEYIRLGIIKEDPFEKLDVTGVGALVEIGVERSRSANPDVKIGVCGEHGGEPSSIAFFDRLGIDYVSCSPYRVPIARLAAAHITLTPR